MLAAKRRGSALRFGHPSGAPGIDSASLRANTRPVERTKNGFYFNATKGAGAEPAQLTRSRGRITTTARPITLVLWAGIFHLGISATVIAHRVRGPVIVSKAISKSI